MPTFNSCTKCLGSPGIINDLKPDCHPVCGHGCMDDVTTERSFDSLATCVIDVLGVFVDMFAICVCTTRHWQTSGRPVQELNFCTVISRR